MLKSEETPISKIDILHNNYKSKFSSYKKFIDFVEKFRKLYSNFSESIELIFSKNSSFTDNQPSSLYPLLKSVESHIKWQANEFNRLSQFIHKEIIESFKFLKDSNDKIEGQLYKELTDLNKTLKKSKIKLEENHHLYDTKMKNLEKIITEVKYMKINILTGNNDIKEKKRIINDLITECKMDENKYEKIVDEVNNNIDLVKEKENIIIGFYKGCEQNRINKMKENANILLNSLKDTNTRINNDIIKIFQDTENIEIEKDIIAFEKLVEKIYKVEKPVQFIAYKPNANLNDSLKIIDKRIELDEISINYEIITEFQKNFKNICPKINISEEKNRYELRKLISRLFDKAQNINFVKEDLDNLLSFIKNENYRSYFLKYLTNERTNGKFLRSEKLIKELGIILNQILILAEKEKNYENAKNCIILSQTFFMEKEEENENEENKKIYLMDLIKDNKWIHQINFWQEMIEVEIINDKLKFNEEHPGMERKKSEEALKNVYFSKILTYSHNMCIFNIDKKTTLDLSQILVERYQLSKELKQTLFNSIEDIYNPKKKKKIKNETNKRKKSENEIINQKNQKHIEDDWVIYNDDSKKNDIIVDEFVIPGNNSTQEISGNIINNNNNIQKNENKKEDDDIINKDNQKK